MTNSTPSSSSSGGGAPLVTPKPAAAEIVPKAEDAKDRKRNDPTEEELALVRAKAGFGQITGEASRNTYGGNGGQSGPGRAFAFPSTPGRPRTAFQNTSPHGGGYGSSPGAFRMAGNVQSPFEARMGSQTNSRAGGVQRIQHEVLDIQKYVRISPGITQESGNNVTRMLVNVGHHLGELDQSVGRERQELHHRIGNTRVQLSTAQKEVGERRKQFEDLKTRYNILYDENAGHMREVVALKEDLHFARADAQQSKEALNQMSKRLAAQDEQHMKQIETLELDIKRSHQDRSTALQPYTGFASNAYADNARPGLNTNAIGNMLSGGTSSRRGSTLNPEAADFGPQPQKPDRSEEVLPLLLEKYRTPPSASRASGGLTQSLMNTEYNYSTPLTPLMARRNSGRTIPPQDARLYPDSYNLQSRASRPSSSRNGHGRDYSSSQSGYIRGSVGFGPPIPAAPGPESHLEAFAHQLPAQILPPKAPVQTPNSAVAPVGSGYRVLGDDIMDSEEPMDLNKPVWNDRDVIVGYVRVYDCIEGMTAMHYAVAPYHESDTLLSISCPATWNALLEIGLANKGQSANHVAYLLSEATVRPFVVKRLVLQYIFKNIVQPTVFLGFNAETDTLLGALQTKLRDLVPGVPSPAAHYRERQNILEDHAKIVGHVVESTEGKAFLEQLVDKHTRALVNIMKPMSSCTFDEGTLFKSMRLVISAAVQVSSKMWSSAQTVHFSFPETGSKFIASQMRSRNHLLMNPDQMQAHQMRLMLVVTPCLSLRDDRNVDASRTSPLMRADVLLMK